jgi:hypothetical protein
VGNLNHPGLGAKLQEPDPPKRLGEQVCKLVLGVDVACLDALFLQTASDEVVPHLDVLVPFMKNGVLSSTAPVSLPRISLSSRTSQIA